MRTIVMSLIGCDSMIAKIAKCSVYTVALDPSPYAGLVDFETGLSDFEARCRLHNQFVDATHVIKVAVEANVLPYRVTVVTYCVPVRGK